MFKDMAEFTIKWEIQIEADTHREAAEVALNSITDGTAKVFDVRNSETGALIRVDLCAPETEDEEIHEEQEPVFPNGFEEWQETHFEMVRYILENSENENSFAGRHMDKWGTGGMYDLARELTFKFEHENKGIEWGIDKEYQDALELFFQTEEQYQVTIFKD